MKQLIRNLNDKIDFIKNGIYFLNKNNKDSLKEMIVLDKLEKDLLYIQSKCIMFGLNIDSRDSINTIKTGIITLYNKRPDAKHGLKELARMFTDIFVE